jgi:hypothetical protein
MITTVQNRKSNSFKYTDPEQKPSWMGERFGWVEKWPTEWANEDGMWHTYMGMRAEDQRKGDRYGRNATQYFLDNQDAMVSGGELLADNYKATVLSDGWVTVHSAWQVVFNAIADTSYDAFCTEYQNDPPEAEQIQTLDLEYQHVASCLSGLKQRERPNWAKWIVRGVDMGKVNCAWVDIGFDSQGTGAVIDYGVFRTHGLAAKSSDEAIELAMMTALQSFAVESDDYQIDLAFVDSGYKPEAVYEACRRLGHKYKPLKGPDGNYRQPKESATCKTFFEVHASQVEDQYKRPVWLWHPNTQFWKNWLQERWQCDPFLGSERTVGSMAIYDVDDLSAHTVFAKSMISERLEHVPIPGGGYKAVWNVIDRGNNHFLDAAGYACAAASVLGVRLVPAVIQTKPTQQAVRPVSNPAKEAKRFRQRPGGWMQGVRRRDK